MTAQANNRLISSLKTFSRAASAAVVLVGGLVLMGWALDLTALKSVLPGLATMKPNTALAFILAGVALWLLLTNETQPRLRRVAQVCAVVVALIGLLTLSQDFFGWNLGLDQLLFKESVGSAGTPHPGRMSPITAFNFLLIGCALLFLDVRNRAGWMPAQLLALLAGMTAALALIGYAYSVQSLYQFDPTSPISLHAALTFFALAAATLCARPDQGLMLTLTSDTVGGVMVRRLLPAAIGVPFVLGWLRLEGERAGLYGTEFEVALFAVSNIIVFMTLIWWNAQYLIRVDAERKQAEEAMRASEERFGKAFRASPIAVSLFRRKDETLIDANEAWERLTGYSVREAVGKSGRDLNLFVFPEESDHRMAALLHDGKVRNGELQLRHKAGEMRYVSASGELVNLGGEAAVLSMLEDITERKRAEEKLRRQAEALKRSNEELEQFAYVASHDLQEPLRMVSSYVQLLARRYQGQLDQDADEFIHFAVDGANRMKTLINDLLAYSRVGTRGKPFEPIELETVFDRVLVNLQLSIEEGGVVTTHDPLPTVQADDTQMIQLFQNLIGNAIKFRGEKPPQIHVGAEPRDDAWLFYVRDNGIGLDPQYANRIFLLFQRLHGKDEYPGTGLGLAICKKIVERHGGRIWVESQPGQGTTFYFTLSESELRASHAEVAPTVPPQRQDDLAKRTRELI
jgi:PAS domain S-box-containing protein